jgi:hypothetical protein
MLGSGLGEGVDLGSIVGFHFPMLTRLHAVKFKMLHNAAHESGS